MVLRECWSHLLFSSEENAVGGPFLVSVTHLGDHGIWDSPLSIHAMLLLLLISSLVATYFSNSYFAVLLFIN